MQGPPSPFSRGPLTRRTCRFNISVQAPIKPNLSNTPQYLGILLKISSGYLARHSGRSASEYRPRLSVSAPQLSIFILLQLFFCSATETSECIIEHFVLKLFRGLRGGFVKSLLLFTSQKHTPYFINTESQTCILAKPLIFPTEIDHKGNWSDATS